MKVTVLSKKDVQKAITMTEAIEAVKNAYIQLSRGNTDVPQRSHIPVKDKGVTLFMPAYLPAAESLGTKIVSVFPGNPGKDLPTVHAVVVAIDTETGQPEAVMDGTYLTAVRTGAASGVATELLARKEAKNVCIIGAGIQGRTQLEAVCCVRNIKKVFVYDVNSKASRDYIKEMKRKGAPLPKDFENVASLKEVLRKSDIICTATTSLTPVFDDSDLKPGTHINGVGSYRLDMQEIPEETVARSKVFVDSHKASMAETGDLIIPLKKGVITEEHIQTEIGQVAAGEAQGRSSKEEITFFKSVGVAVQDVAVSKLIVEKVLKQGIGKETEL
ncbi:MAG: ornithine cyclodeaminase family protein [Candidatus Aminicenantaceae bacterium]